MTEAEFNALKPGDVVYWDICSQTGNFFFFEKVGSYTVSAISLDGTIFSEEFRPIERDEAIAYFHLTEREAIMGYVGTLRSTLQACESMLTVALGEASRLTKATPP